jgi:hypothetical protein
VNDENPPANVEELQLALGEWHPGFVLFVIEIGLSAESRHFDSPDV